MLTLMAEHKPVPGEDYFRGEEEEYSPQSTTFKIEEVGERFEDGGWEVLTSDGIWGVVYWSERHKLWVTVLERSL